MDLFHTTNRITLHRNAIPTSAARRRRYSGAAWIIGGLTLSSGCARLPPGQNSSIALSGHRLHVIIPFRDRINSNYTYFFLINYDQSQGVIGNQNAPGPVPVINPFSSSQGQTFGNGFAASSSGDATPGFTDFVRFDINGYQLLHVSSSDRTGKTFIPEGRPDTFFLPGPNNPNQLEFTVDLSHLVAAASGGQLSATDTTTQAQNIKWLQVNIVATNFIPVDLTPPGVKQVDSLGNTQGGVGSFLNLNVLFDHTYLNGDPLLSSTSFEPADNDVYTNGISGIGDESLDITQNYSISVTTNTTGTQP